MSARGVKWAERLVVRGKAIVVVMTGLGAAAVACSKDAPNDEHTTGGDGGVLPDASTQSDAGLDAESDGRATGTCSEHGFCHTPIPGNATVVAAWGDGHGAVWAVTEAGTVLRWDGAVWKAHVTLDGPLTAIWGSGPTDVWIAGRRGLWHGSGDTPDTLDFAITTLPGDDAAPIVSVWGSSADDVWAVGGSTTEIPHVARVLHFARASSGTDPNWELDPLSAEPLAFTHVWGSREGGVWLSGLAYDDAEFADYGVVYRRSPHAPGAGSFVAEPLPGRDDGPPFGRFAGARSVATLADGEFLVLGTTGDTRGAYWRARTTDGGRTFAWTFEESPVSGIAENAAWGTRHDDVWIGSDFGQLKHWDGRSWKPAILTLTGYPVTAPLRGFWGIGGEELWVVGDGIALRRELAE